MELSNARERSATFLRTGPCVSVCPGRPDRSTTETSFLPNTPLHISFTFIFILNVSEAVIFIFSKLGEILIYVTGFLQS